MSKYLVIVESPTKARTITKFIGENYEIMSSMGHLVDLPKSDMGVDVENGFKPKYIVIAKRKKTLSDIKKASKEKEGVYLAMDPDREGEAIAFHLKNQLAGSKEIHRVTFHEITERAIKDAMAHAHDIDMNLVNAQQGRRVLDRLLGYNLSPLLWKKVSKGLSAGRVQSVALRLIVEREKKIGEFVPEEYWEIEARLKQAEAGKDEAVVFTAKLVKVDNADFRLKARKEAEGLAAELEKSDFLVANIRETKKRRNPPAPFTTSTLQQEAFNKLRFPVSKTMKIAQELYEGIELGEQGATGLITYMRTDSVNISRDAAAEAREYVINKYGSRYYPAVPHKYKSKKGAQEAHEAIRPALPLRDPISVRDSLMPAQYRLYELIWNRFLTSQMESALLKTTSVDIMAGRPACQGEGGAGRCLFRSSGTAVLFDGFTVLYNNGNSDRESVLPPLGRGEKLILVELLPGQHFTSPPPRFSDASLVKMLEEKGIGRPSTYAPTISTIIKRNYVKREKGYLHPTELGTIVTELLIKHFPRVLDLKFTAVMEEELDRIEEGTMEWANVVKDFYTPFHVALEKAKNDMRAVKKEVVPTSEKCELCGGPMVIKWGRRGKFLSCTGFPKCRFSKSIGTGVRCPQEGCDGELIERRSYRGTFYGCSRYPKCTYTTRRLPDGEEADADGSAGEAETGDDGENYGDV